MDAAFGRRVGLLLFGREPERSHCAGFRVLHIPYGEQHAPAGARFLNQGLQRGPGPVSLLFPELPVCI